MGKKNVAIIRLELKEVNRRKQFFLFGKNYFYSIKIIILPCYDYSIVYFHVLFVFYTIITILYNDIGFSFHFPYKML